MKIGFIGCGNMGGALASAVAKNSNAEIYLCDAFAKKAEELADIPISYILQEGLVQETVFSS